MATKNPYSSTVLSLIPRILGLLDRDKDSGSYGCFDRNFWHYKIRDFASGILQQSVLSLSLIYKFKFEGNTYYKKRQIKDYAIAAIEFWSRTQHKDGSFDEYWPNEHGYPPTVFSLYAVCESCKLLNYNKKDIIKSIIKSCNYLLKNKEDNALNQEIAAVTALYSAYKYIKSLNKKEYKNYLEKLKKGIDNKKNKVLKKQNKEGWFSEYKGMDVGYLSVSLSYLAYYYQMSKDKKLLSAIKKTTEFISYFVHPDGSCGGDYGSRNTTYFLMGGLEIIGKELPIAYSIADKFLENKLYNIDDRYTEHYILHSMITAAIFYEKRDKKPKKEALPYEKVFEKQFNEAKIYIKSTENSYIIVGLGKGGIIKAFDKKSKRLVFNDCGYKVKLNKKKKFWLVTNWIGNYKIKVKDDILTISGKMYKMKYLVVGPLYHTALRALSFVFGKRLIPLLKGKLILSNKESNVVFERKIDLSKNDIISIKDNIKSPEECMLKSTNSFSMRYVPSSKYFETNELDNINNEISCYGYSFSIDTKVALKQRKINKKCLAKKIK